MAFVPCILPVLVPHAHTNAGLRTETAGEERGQQGQEQEVHSGQVLLQVKNDLQGAWNGGACCICEGAPPAGDGLCRGYCLTMAVALVSGFGLWVEGWLTLKGVFRLAKCKANKETYELCQPVLVADPLVLMT